MILLLAAALGGPTESLARQRLEDALLARALGDHERSRSVLLTLANSLAADDPVRGWALFWLATERLEWDRVDAARESLRDCIRSGPARDVCQELLARVELEQRAARTLPTTWTFEGPHGVILPGPGRMALESGDLVWTHVRDPANPGTLLFGTALPPDAPPSTITLSLTSVDRESWIGIVLVDVDGNVTPAPEGVQRVAADRTTALVTRLDHANGLDASRLERVLIRDVTGMDDAGSTSVLRLHELQIE